MKHIDLRSQSSVEPLLLSRLPTQLPTSSVQAQGGRLVEDDVKGHLNNRAPGIMKESDALKCDKLRAHQNSSNTTPGSTATGLLLQTSELKNEEVVQVFLTLFWNHTLDLTFFIVKLKKFLICVNLLICRHTIDLIYKSRILLLSVSHQVGEFIVFCSSLYVKTIGYCWIGLHCNKSFHIQQYYEKILYLKNFLLGDWCVHNKIL